MNQEQLKQIAQKTINKDKWWDILSRFIDVLRINIFLVDCTGSIILPPEEGRCGGRLLTERSLGFDLLCDSGNIMKQFDSAGHFLESVNKYGLYSFAIPINIADQQTIAYMIVGPVILNKRLDSTDYMEMAKQFGVKGEELLAEINEIRVVSNLMIGSILDLLAEIVKDSIELTIKEKELDQIKLDQETYLKSVKQGAREIYSTVHLDELLVTFLDLALRMTNTECGSIMVRDDDHGDLIIKVSRGLDGEQVQNTRVKVGEGISGRAVKQNISFVINGQNGEGTMQALLRRSDIKQSLVMPLVAKNRVFGVLNLHTKKDEAKIEDNVDNLQYLSKLISSAF